jgi:hypothetical protein
MYLIHISEYPMATAILFAEYVHEQPHLLVEKPFVFILPLENSKMMRPSLPISNAIAYAAQNQRICAHRHFQQDFTKLLQQRLDH